MKQFYLYCSNEFRNMLEPHDANHMMRHNQIPPVVSGGTTTVCCTVGPHLCCFYWPAPPKPTIYSIPPHSNRFQHVPVHRETYQRYWVYMLPFGFQSTHYTSWRCKCPALSSGFIVTLTSNWHKIIWGKIANLLPKMGGIIFAPSKFTFYIIGSHADLFQENRPPGSSANSVCRTGSIGSGGSGLCKVSSASSASESSRNDHSNGIQSLCSWFPGLIR